MIQFRNFTAGGLLGVSLMASTALYVSEANAQEQTLDTRIGKLTFTHDFANGYPTEETVQKLYDERDFQRAVQLYLWAAPMVSNGEVRRVLMEADGARYGDLIPLSKVPDLSRFLTANVTTPYTLSWLNLAKMGPVVLDIPAGPSAGFVDDLWQRPVMDVGTPGVNKGKGGKFLLLGPGQKAPSDAKDYTVVNSPNFNNLFLFRFISPDEKVQKEMLEKMRIYAYSEKDTATSVRLGKLKQGSDVVANNPRGLAFWTALAQLVDEEPVHERDRIMMAMLRSIGIEKGKPFEPTDRQVKLLTEATLIGEAMARANDFAKRDIDLAYYADGVNWEFALVLDPKQEAKYYTQLDERSAWFYEAATASNGMVTTTPGVGSIYLSTYKDSNDNWLDGANNYKLNLPANVPAKNFWSMTFYDVDTRMLIKNNTDNVDVNSRHDLVVNSDGSIDIYAGPTAPKGFEKNWVPTLPGKAWFPYFRLYGPTKAHFDRSWVIPDFEKLK
jgi:hypothetical protein